MNVRTGFPRFLALLVLSTAASLCAAQTYTVTDLGTLPGGNSSGAKAINLGGEVTGWAYSNSTTANVFLYSNGAMQDLGSLGGDYSIARAINDRGQIVGMTSSGAFL